MPAVEAFEPDQLEPELVIVGHGAEEEILPVKEALASEGFHPQAREVEG